MERIVVLMSVYKNDCLNYLRQAVQSVLTQEKVSVKLFLMVDGPVNKDVTEYLSEISSKDTVVVWNDQNKGLAFRLNQAIELALESSSTRYIARMDADDVCRLDRFFVQKTYLELHQEIDVLGSDVNEIDELNQVVFYKKMDAEHSVLRKNIIRKCPFNHPAVMFRADFLRRNPKIRYKSQLLNTQDYYLWVDMAAAGAKFANINQPLLNFRVDSGFHSRRGFAKAINDFNARFYAMSQLQLWSFQNVVITMALFFLRVSPKFIKMWAYENLR